MQLVEAASSWTALRERKPRSRVAIVTNRPAPYRKTLFDLLVEGRDLEYLSARSISQIVCGFVISKRT